MEVLAVLSKLLITPVQEWEEVQLELYKTTKVQDSLMIKDRHLKISTPKELVSIRGKEDKILTTQEFTTIKDLLLQIDKYAKEDQARTGIKIKVQTHQQAHS